MRLNKFLAQATGLSRRTADQAISQGRVLINGQPAQLGQSLPANATISLDNQPLQPKQYQTIMLNKPVGYICSRQGQGGRTIYDLLPKNWHHLKPIGRLDKNSSGLLLLTNNGDLANQLAHPRHQKTKIYQVQLNKPLTDQAKRQLKQGVQLADGPSHLDIEPIKAINTYQVRMTEGRNRQIRRTFATLGYQVKKLHRTNLGTYHLANLPIGQYRSLE